MTKFVEVQHAFLTMMEGEDLETILYIAQKSKSSRRDVTTYNNLTNTPAPSETMNSDAGYHSVDRNRASKNSKYFGFITYQCNEEITVDTLKRSMPSFFSKPNFLCKHLEWLMDGKVNSAKMNRFDLNVGM